MEDKARNIFRQEALDALSSPEQLDRLMQITSPQAWLPLLATGLLVVGTGIWSVVGRIPLTVTGKGILIRPRTVLQLQASSTGQLLNLNIKPGDKVKLGQVLGTIDQSQLQQQLLQEEAKLAELQAQNQDSKRLQQQQFVLEKNRLQQERQTLAESLNRESLAPSSREKARESLLHKKQSLEESLRREQTAPTLLSQSQAALKEKRQSLEMQRHQNQELVQAQLQRVESRRKLVQEGVLSREQLLQTQQEYFNTTRQLSDVEAQLKELDVQQTNSKQDYLKYLNRIDEIKNSIKDIDVQLANVERDYLQSLNRADEIKTKLKSLDTQETQLAQQNLEQSNNKANQIQEVKRRIAQIKLQLTKDSKITSPYDGKVLEVATLAGQLINSGARLATIEAEDSKSKITSLIYFADKDGKLIKSGMEVQVTPSVVKRERYGGIVGKVTQVSTFPVTSQDIAVLVGNQELANSLAGQGEARIQVFAELEEDKSTKNGYKWSSSKGPDVTISSGTTTEVRVKVDEVAPISYIIPLFRSWTGIY
jgi:multidrug resistance efflux pump